jgi:membrane-bound lytic murein transglycosylase D
MKNHSIQALALALLLTLAGLASSTHAAEQTPEVRIGAAPSTRIQPDAFASDLPNAPNATDAPLSPIISTPTDAQAVAAMTAPVDLWARIRRGFGMPGLDHDLVRDREQWFSARPDYILRMTERSRKYMFYIVEELERRNMPSELALLPFVESAFNPQAVSSAKAAGMWQFMPATGKTFDLKQNAFRDDRRDVLASTRAALDYLQKLHGMFGDWHLALAAYNWGEGSVGRAIAKNQRAGLGVSYLDLKMPNETRLYVPKLIALKNIVATPAAFNSSLPLIENHPFFQTVDITRDIDVALAAKLAEVSLLDFKALNPSASRPVILAAGTPQLLLPWDNAVVFQNNLNAYAPGRLASWTVWQAPATLKTAEVAKRVGMSEEALRSLNNIPPRVLIKAGSSLLVPRSSHLETDVALQVADHGQMSLAPEIVLKRSVIKAGKKDTVASLALRYGVSAANLADWNKTTPLAVFKSGQAVVLFLPASARTLAKGKNHVKSNKTALRPKGKNTKTVQVAKQ